MNFYIYEVWYLWQVYAVYAALYKTVIVVQADSEHDASRILFDELDQHHMYQNAMVVWQSSIE